MRPYRRAVLGWLVVGLVTECVVSQTSQLATMQPATDTILTAGDIQVAHEHWRVFGFDPGPVKGAFTPETQSAVRAYQAHDGVDVTGRLDRATPRGLLPGFDQQPRL